MAEYIDKKELDIAFTDKCTGDCGCCQYWNADSYEYDCKLIHNFPTANVIPIPEGATNGDMIKAMFPNCEQKEHIHNGYFEMYFDGDFGNPSYMRVRESWWNAPYKRGNKNESID